MEERIAKNSKKLANDHIEAHKEQVSKAQEHLDKYKDWHEDAGSIKELKMGILTPVEDKSLIARTRLDCTLELVQWQKFALDIAPGLSFDFTKRVSMAWQFMYRVESLEAENREVGPTYGPRLGLSFALGPSLYAIVQGEQLRYTIVPDVNGPLSTVGQRSWYRGVFAGLGKSYAFGKRITGQLIAFYNFYGDSESPYPNKFNVRISIGLMPGIAKY